MKDKHGFSLIELIVVVAIMGALLAVGTVSLSLLTHQKAKAASKSVYNMLGSTQNVAISKGNTLFGIVCNSDGTTYVYTLYSADGPSGDYEVIQSQKIGSAVQISFKAKDGSEYYIGKNNTTENGVTYKTGVIIDFNRNTGAFSGTYLYSGDLAHPKGSSIDNCTNIYIAQGGRNYNIVLVALTGKFYYD